MYHQKYKIALVLGIVVSLSSCSPETNPMPPKPSTQNTTNAQSGTRSIGGSEKTGAIVIDPTGATNSGITSTNSGALTRKTHKDPFIQKLLDIEVFGITTPLLPSSLMDVSALTDSGTTDNGSIRWNKAGLANVGTIQNWETALNTPCTDTGATNIPIYSPQALSFDPVIPLEQDRYCVTKEFLSGNDVAVQDIFDIFSGKSDKKSFSNKELSTERLRSNRDVFPSNPRTPLERLLETQFFFGMSNQRFIAARPYKNEVLILFADSQEGGLPYYRLTRVFMQSWNLITLPRSSIDEGVMYWTGFTNKLWNRSYSAAYAETKEDKKRFNKEELRLLSGDWMTNPSIIEKRIEERLILDLNNLK